MATQRSTTTAASPSAVRLRCGVRDYAWGKRGASSAVGSLALAGGSIVAVEPDRPYAELWVGTHPSLPSFAASPSSPARTSANGSVAGKTAAGDQSGAGDVTLKEFCKERGAEFFGAQHIARFGADFPFLLKVLSVGGALSVQAHPTKAHAEELHAKDPAHYPDANHKPELVVALTKFHALCCFRPLSSIALFVGRVAELRKLLGPTAAAPLLESDVSNAKAKDVLRAALAALYALDKAHVLAAAETWASELEATRHVAEVNSVDLMFLSLHRQYPGDVGCFLIYFLNFVTLNPGEGLFLAPNEPHAYLSGDCVEIMATSDNVVRAGLTPKFKDVDTLLKMLSYRVDALNDARFTAAAGPVQRYAPPPTIPEFALHRVELDAGATTSLSVPSAALAVVVRGSGHIAGAAVKAGDCVALPIMQEMRLGAGASQEGLQVFVASTRLMESSATSSL